MITKEQALAYEVESLSFFQSIIYNHFFGYFMRRFEKKYARYREFLSEHDKTGKYFQRYL